MSKRNRFSPEVQERAVRMVFEHEADSALKKAGVGGSISCNP